MENRCPRCGNLIREGAGFCPNCGLPLSPTPGNTQAPPADTTPDPIRSQPPVPYIPDPAKLAWTGPSQPPPAYTSARSVVIALTPSRPPTPLFWLGLVLTILALVLVACPSLLAFSLAVDPDLEEPGSIIGPALGLTCCLFLGLFAPGLILIAAGRPRKSL